MVVLIKVNKGQQRYIDAGTSSPRGVARTVKVGWPYTLFATDELIYNGDTGRSVEVSKGQR